MAEYKHGTYGEFASTIDEIGVAASTLPVYVGSAPVNLVRGYEDAVNAPIIIKDFEAAKRLVGYSDDWENFDICEALKLHFNNPAGNVGPIVVINVLDPATHVTAEKTTVSLTFVNGRATIGSDKIILDTLVLADKVENTDFTISYDFAKSMVIIDSIGTAITGSVQATYSTVDATAVDANDVIGTATDAGVYTGLGCIRQIYTEYNLVANLIICPKWSSKPAVYEAMIAAGTKINGHWDAFVYADIPVMDGNIAVDTMALAKAWQKTNGYTNERSKVFWPQGEDASGKIYHLAVLAAWRTQLIDAEHGGVPMESPSNKSLPVVKQHFGANSTNKGFDQSQGNALNKVGITTIVFWGGMWVLWGPHSAAYNFDSVTDKRAIFDNSIRMMMYITNSFQSDHALTIDRPMTRAMADTIKNREQEKADALVAMGALIGSPTVEFNETDNSATDLAEGNFIWNFAGTPTVPFKSGTLKVAYSTAGFTSYLGGE